MTDPLYQAAIHAFAAIEILATGTEAPDDRLRSAQLRLHHVRAFALPAPLRDSYQGLMDELAAALAGDQTVQLPISRLTYTTLSTQICAFYRLLVNQLAPQVSA